MYKLVLSCVALLSFSAKSFAAIGPEGDISKSGGQAIILDKTSGVACSVSLKVRALRGVLTESEGELQSSADEIISNIVQQDRIFPCSGKTLADASELLSAMQNGQHTAMAPAIWVGLSYYAACTAVNLKATADAIGTAMALGGNGKWKTAEWLSATVCVPVSVVNLGILIVGSEIARQFQK